MSVITPRYGHSQIAAAQSMGERTGLAWVIREMPIST